MLRNLFNLKCALKYGNQTALKNVQTCCHNLLSTSQVQFQNISSESPISDEKKLKILQLEVDVARQEGRRAPSPEFIKPEQWQHLLTLNSRSARTKYYSFLWQLEKKMETRKIKKEKRKEEMEQRKAELNEGNGNDHIVYGLSHTSFLLRIYETTINFWNNNKLIRAMQFGEKVIFDCSYDKQMNDRECKNAAKQLMLSFSQNRFHDDPFDLHFCNVNKDGLVMKQLQKYIPTMYDPEFPLNIHEKCFTELFPKRNLVYLTPHCRNDLEKYNPDDIYIVGAMVDKARSEPLSLAKAKRLNLRMARLPLDRYLQWGGGSGKSLTLNQMVDILLDIKQTKDWDYALRHVPRRKLVQMEEEFVKQNKVKTRLDRFKFDIDTWGEGRRFIKR